MYVWFLTFESKRIVKVGGLGEVPPSIGEALARKGYRVEVVMPSHGVVYRDDFVNSHELEVVLEDKDNGYKIYYVKDVNPPHILLSNRTLDHPEVYGDKVLHDKVIDYARLVSTYVKHKLRQGDLLPNIIHCNDWHTVPVLLVLKRILKSARFIYQVHLLSNKKIEEIDFNKIIGLRDKVPVNINGFIEEIEFEKLTEISNNMVERMGFILADMVVTVSKHYLVDILSRVGWEFQSKADVIYNGTDWDINKIYGVLSKEDLFREKLSGDPLVDRGVIRRILLTNMEKLVDAGEYVSPPREIREFLANIEGVYPFKEDLKVYSFNSDGPLLIMTGRLTVQKGWDILLESLDYVLFKVPNTRALLFPLYVGGHLDLVKKIVDTTRIYCDNVRAIFGLSKKLYYAAHVAADVMAAPSLFEPFGIMALEAMSCGTPVVASKTGGLSETILDIREHGVEGTGILVKPGSPRELAHALADMLLFMESSYHKPWSTVWRNITEEIESIELSRLLKRDPDTPVKIRRSCIRRAKMFSWSSSASKAEEIYKKVLV